MKTLRSRRGLTVGSQVNGRIRILDSGQTECTLDGLQQLQVDAGFLTDLPRRHANAVVPDDIDPPAATSARPHP